MQHVWFLFLFTFFTFPSGLPSLHHLLVLTVYAVSYTHSIILYSVNVLRNITLFRHGFDLSSFNITYDLKKVSPLVVSF